MKVKLLTYFKANGTMYPAGTVYDSAREDLPDWVQDLVQRQHKNIAVTEVDIPKKVSTPAKEVKSPVAAKPRSRKATKAKPVEDKAPVKRQKLIKRKPGAK